MAKPSTTATTSQKKNAGETRTSADTAKANQMKTDSPKSGMAKNSTFTLYEGAKTNASSTSSSKAGTQNKTGSKEGSKKQKTLDDLFQDELKDVYSAEKQLVEALPKLAEAAHSEELKDAFTKHLQQTKRHVERIEKVMDKLKIKHEEEKCLAMEGLIKEGEKIIEEFESSHVRDSALIIGSQKVEHYEIASYGSLCELADVLGYHRISEFLGRTLDEEERTDKLLTRIAQDVNDDAYEMKEREKNKKEEYEKAY